ncbi:MAG: TonB-dependent receptor [Bacteroidetes bacterium]|nr:MAG: TonB-dependent receptor [Bacteroidota bacterium]
MKLYKLIYILLLLAHPLTSLFPQTTGKISGKVKDVDSNEPVIGCNVVILGTSLGASTDAEGVYYILNVPPGKYDVQASILGYQTVTQRDAIVNSGRTTTMDFTLSSKELTQKEVIIAATRPDVEPEKVSTSTIVRFDDVQSIAGIRDVGDILSLSAEVTDGHFRGGRSNEEYYTLQGMGIVNPLDNSSAFLPIMSAVEEVEVITSGFGAQYGNAQSGVVNISMKEGKSDKWRTRVESRTRAPGKKHYGGSVYDPAANPYLAQLLYTDSLWRRGDPDAPSTSPYYTTYFGRDRYRGDTLVQLQVARLLWQAQQHRDLFKDYGNDLDYSIEATSGGPLDKNLRMFMAYRSNVTWPRFPTEQPDIERQVFGNIVSEFGGSAALRLSGGYNRENTNVFPGSDGTGFYTWLWDRILGISYQERTNIQLGARFTHTLSSSTFYEIKLNSLFTKRELGSNPTPSSIPDSLVVIPENRIDWDKIIPQVVRGPDGFYYLRGDDDFRNEKTRTVSLDASLSSQVTKSHLLNAGVQLNSYDIDVSSSRAVRDGNGGDIEVYNAKPFEAALYAQDKMEFEGMIASVGLRFDLWDANSDFYSDLVVPYRYIDKNGDTLYDPARAQKSDAPALGRLQPRVGVSFPVSVNTVFHLNYGTFMQRPPFQNVVYSRVQQGSLQPRTFGNPRLEPQTTNSYDVGITQGFGEGFTLDVSGYYKDVKNLLQGVSYQSVRFGPSYTTYFNLDYADIRGFRVAFAKRRGEFTGSINYQFSVATGKSATTSNAPIAYVENPSTFELSKDPTQTSVPLNDILLDFDRTHNLVIDVGYVSGDEWGPQLFGVYPFEGVTLSAHTFFRSGLPYTSPATPKLINEARTPGESNTNLRLTKRIPNFFGVNAMLYFEIFNLFDEKILNYEYVFPHPTPGQTTNITSNYENYSIDDPVNGIRYYQELNVRPGWALVDQSFLIYENQPRSFNFGISIEM